MKNLTLVFALFALFFAVSCDSDVKFENPNDQNSDTHQGESDQNTPDYDSEPADDTDVSDNNTSDTDDDSDNAKPDSDNPDTTPDDGDIAEPTDDSDTTTEDSDSMNDDDTPQELNENDEDNLIIDDDILNTEQEECASVGGNWNGSSCTRTANCSPKPENTEWNTVSSITQTWNGSTWNPSNVGVYNTTASSSECRYTCKQNYNWNGNKCAAKTKNGTCSSKPKNTVWNDSGRNGTFAQTWNGEMWVPTSHDAIYSKTPLECGFVCATGYLWDGSKCETAPTQSAKCTGLPYGAEWNTATSITQTWDGEKWIPESTAGVYNEAASTTECRYKCKIHYTWSGSACVADTKNYAWDFQKMRSGTQ